MSFDPQNSPRLGKTLAERCNRQGTCGGAIRVDAETGDAFCAACGWSESDLRAELLDALQLILPLAKGYAPEGQTATARATCRSWIEAAEAVIAKATQP